MVELDKSGRAGRRGGLCPAGKGGFGGAVEGRGNADLAGGTKVGRVDEDIALTCYLQALSHLFIIREKVPVKIMPQPPSAHFE